MMIVMNKEANTVIDLLGGTNATARLCEIQPPSVSEWRKNGIPKAWRKYLKDIRPDVFSHALKRS